MFENLSDRLGGVFDRLTKQGALSEEDVTAAMREVRVALLEADVNFQVTKDFVARVKEKCLGKEVLDSITPGQQVVKHVHDELVSLLGGAHRDFDFSARPATVLLLGLHGAGKTTTAGKLALRWKKAGKKVLLVACDLRRPAAVDQLRILAGQVGVEIATPAAGETVAALGARALKQAIAANADVVLFDTGGRFQIDTDLVQELKDLREAIKPRNVVLVLDSAIGQESVHVAETFHKEVGLTGLILTKLDGDARGGAALSVQAVTGCPILLVGMGEKPEDLEPFYPDRMASRILGMGDVVSLVEKAQGALDEKEMARMQERALEGDLNLDDFLAQLQQMKKMGPLENLLEMLPGAGNVPARLKNGIAGVGDKDLKKSEAIIRSMTPRERRNPGILDASRRRRIALGSGTEVRDVNELLNNFAQAKKMAQQLKKAQKRLLRFGK